MAWVPWDQWPSKWGDQLQRVVSVQSAHKIRKVPSAVVTVTSYFPSSLLNDVPPAPSDALETVAGFIQLACMRFETFRARVMDPNRPLTHQQRLELVRENLPVFMFNFARKSEWVKQGTKTHAMILRTEHSGWGALFELLGEIAGPIAWQLPLINDQQMTLHNQTQWLLDAIERLNPWIEFINENISPDRQPQFRRGIEKLENLVAVMRRRLPDASNDDMFSM
jgi:hypothetical protein